MFSAESDGKTYYAWDVHDPKSRAFACRYCKRDVIYISPSTRDFGKIPVSAHFRHKPTGEEQGILWHPEREASFARGDVVQALVENFEPLDFFYEFETDKVHDLEGRCFASDFSLVRKHSGRETVFFVEDSKFNARELKQNIRALTTNDISSAIIFCAQGEKNPQGFYFRDLNDPKRPADLKKIDGNEKAVYDLVETNFYFDHDTKEFFAARFHSYRERGTDYWGNPAQIEKKTFKKPLIAWRSRRVLPIGTINTGLLFSRLINPELEYGPMKCIGELDKAKKLIAAKTGEGSIRDEAEEHFLTDMRENLSIKLADLKGKDKEKPHWPYNKFHQWLIEICDELKV
ncbi:hypothetical protein KY346_01095 [Candidatus Woesearchaeota archaeon]|nr:hypothetical protein [Candidatus Woesearchaeota archaeon]